MSLPRLSIRRPVAVAMFFIAVVMLGVLSITRLPIDLLPDIAYPKLVVYTTYPNVAPTEVERFVTEPVEQEVASVPGIERLESVSREGVSLVTLRFAWGTDMDFAALNVREKLDALKNSESSRLPEGASRPLVLRTDPTSEPIMTVSVAGRGDLWALKDLAESVIKRRFEQIDGVAQAAVVGGLEREIQVEVDARALDRYGVTIDQVSSALAAANQNAPGGTIRRGRYRYALRTLGEFRDVADIREVVVARGGGGGSQGDQGGGQGGQNGQNGQGGQGGGGGTVFLRDVATVTDGFRERESITRYDGEESVGLLLFKAGGSNTVRVTERVEEVLGQLRTQYPDLSIAVATAQAGFISDSIANLVQDVVIGGILAFLVLFLFLRDVRVPIAIGVVIPISIIATFALFDAAGISINIMSLGGLALGVGLLMDNSIVVVENIFRQRELGLSPIDAAAVGTEEVQRAITASTLTTIAVFGPIVYVEGIAGALFGSLSFAVAFALGSSVIVACALLPAMASRWRERAAGGAGRAVGGAEPAMAVRPRPRAPGPVSRFLDAFDRGFARFTAWYERQLAWSLDHRGLVMLGAAVLLAVTALVMVRLPRSVLPEVDQGSFRVSLALPRGTPIERTAADAERLEAAIRADAAVAAVFTRIGRQAAVAGVDDASGLHTALLDVRLKEGHATADVVERLEPALAPFAGMATVETGHATALGKLLGGGEADLAVRVRADDLEGALGYAQQVERSLRDLPELTNVRLGTELGHPEMRVEVNRERAAAFGISAREIAQAVERYMRGESATDFVDFDRKIPVMVRLNEAERRSLEVLQEVRLKGVPMRELITVREGMGPTEVRRVDQGRVVAVYADVVGGDIALAEAAIRAALAPLPAPHGMRIAVTGENEEMRRSFAALAFAMLLALLLVYMILAAEFESLVHPFIVLLAVPLASLGAAVALWVTGNGLNVVSLIGMVVLIGIVDNDAVVKIDFINQMRAKGHSVRRSIMEAGHSRLRPILINTITAMLGMLPMALGIGPGAQLQAPMAVALFGGLFTATALTLIVIPVAYSLAEELRIRLGVVADAPVLAPDALPDATPGD